jgi:hypothetical protein
MARTWTFEVDLALGASRVINDNGDIAAGNNVLYFYDRLIGGHGTKVWSWDGTTLTDISASTFPGNTGAKGLGIAWFGDHLYLLWLDPTQSSGSRLRVFEWDGVGTQTWTQRYAFAAIGGEDPTGGYLACDDNRMAVLAASASDHHWLVASADGTTWTGQTIESRDPDSTDPDFVLITIGPLLGTGRGSDYGLLTFQAETDLASPYPKANFVAPSSGNDWSLQANAAADTGYYLGYAQGYSWFSDLDLSFYGDVSRSLDWGVTLTDPATVDASGLNRYVWPITGGVTMYSLGYDNQAWTYDGTTFVADGTTPAGDLILAFFTLNSILYCICDGNEIYSSPLPTAKFYQSVNGLMYRSDLPLPGVLNPDGLAVRPDRKAVAGSRAANAQMIAQAAPTDSYATWDDLTDSYPTNKPVKALRDI